MRIKVCIIVILGWLLASCSLTGGETPTEVAQPAVETDAPAEPVETQAEVSRGLPVSQGELFSTSGNCAMCHTGMTNDAGEDVSMGNLWRSSMMANAARDPYWRASVQHEVSINPELRDVIMDKCMTCHMPMGLKTTHAGGGMGAMFGGGGMDDPENSLHQFAIDGVSCTVCHQILEDGLGTEATFSGSFEIDTETEMGQRIIYGPYDVEDSLNELMRSASGFNSQKAEHIAQASLCGSCHTLYTNYVDSENGEVSSTTFPEQMQFIEWSHSSYPGERVCQDCHMPVIEGSVKISTAGGDPREGVSQHEFVGGNAYMISLLKEFGDELGVTATSDQFDSTIALAQEQVQENAARISVENVETQDGVVRFDVLVEALTGHKFPTGFPSRRAWLNVIVTDANGDIVFESGSWQNDGLIKESEYDASPSGYEPHYDLITSADQVQVYQPILKNSQGEVTTVLLHAAGYLKDNRLLPAGFDKNTAAEDISVQGEAAADDDFVGGSDRVTYEITIDEAVYPLQVEATLLYQSISYRWAMNLIAGDGPMIDRFAGYYDALDNIPIVVDTAQVEVAE